MRTHLSLIGFLMVTVAWSQEPMRVERCTAVSPDAPVYNIHVDEEDNKWVSNSEGLWQVHAADLATPLEVPSGEVSLLSFPDGNHDLRWSKGELNSLLDGALSGSNEITCGFYNAVQDHLWIGTSETGLFMFRTQPKFRWAKEISRRMPKLRSNHINSIYIDGDEDRHFFATNEGVAAGRDGRWGLEERYFRFQAIANRGQEVWLLAEDLIWVVNADDDWRSVDIDPEQVQGEIKDIAFDRDGRLWIASEYLTMYDPENETYKIFDGADYFTSSNVNCIAVDRTGAVWVGTQDKGLYLIEKESAMTVTCLVDQELSCVPDTDDASLIVKINGGQPPYTYVWEGEDLTGDNPQGLGPGKYVVSVTDSRGQTKVAEGIVEDTRIHLSIEAEQPATPDGSSKGSATATVEGGKPKLVFQWDNGEAGPRAENLTAGLHQLTVTDARGCKAEGTVEISQEIGELTVSLEKTQTTLCAGDGKNAVKANVSGGLAPYAFKWSDPALTGAEVSGMGAGLYYVTVSDSRGKSASTSINIEAIEALQLTATASGVARPGKADGRAVANVTGGTGKYTYAWDNGEKSKNAENLSPGKHTVTVTDEAGCVVEGSVEISQEIGELSVSMERTGTSDCAGDGKNSVRVNVNGGLAPYTYQWSSADLSGNEATGMTGGLYYVTVSDNSGKSASTSINLEAIEPIELNATATAAASTGNADGRATVSAKGGTGKYTYAWDSGEKTKNATNLSPGMHSVTVTDEAGCTETAEIEISEDIAELSVVLDGLDIPCFGDQSGEIEALIRGGKKPFSIVWNQPDLNGDHLTGLTGGSYAITVTDAVGNQASASLTLNEPDELSAEIVEQRGVTDEASKDGKAQIEVNGGSGSYEIVWDNQVTGDKVDNLSLGSHSVTVTDGNNCSISKTFEVEQKILPQLTLSKLRSGQVVQMQMLQFDADSTNINESAKPVLTEVYQFLKDNPAVVIRVEGHTNNIPPDEFCDRLSTARAKSVAEYIVQQGIADERVYYKGYGKRNPIYSNRTAEGRRKNQRVEIQILKVREDG